MDNILIKKKKKEKRAALVSKFLTFAVLCLSLVPIFAFAEEAAAGTSLSDAVVKICEDIGALMTTVLNPICAVVIGFCILSLVLGKSSRSADVSLQWIKRTAICFVAFNCIGLFLSYGTTLIDGIGGKQW